MNIILLTMMLVLSFTSPNTQTNESSKLNSKFPTVAFCDLLNNPDSFRGKEVRFRAKFISAFETSSFYDAACFDITKRTWVEFAQSLKDSTKPEIRKKLSEAFCCRYAGESMWIAHETELFVTGIFYESSGVGYGHKNEYRFLVAVTSVETVGATKKTDLTKN